MFIVKKVHQSCDHCCLCSIGQVVPPLEHPKVVRKLPQGCHDIFFLFSKCLTYSHNASAVSLIFFCDSEYDQSLVLRSRFPVWSAPRTSRYLRMTKSDPCRRDWNMIILFICLLRQCRKCSTVGKSLIFFKLRFLLRERICFNGPVLAPFRTACLF